MAMNVRGYTDTDQERFIDEPAKRAGRTEFMRDRARVIHSAALRRLAAKTQVAVPWENDFQRTRLSHSLECAQIGRELGESLGADPDLLETACLSHDLGHPPFGHNGEEALADLAQSCGGFEGNAQSFRLLTRIEAKTVSESGKSVGLNLTRASLDAATKYPWSNQINPKKFGVYSDDEPIFNWMRQGAPEGKKCIEAQIMDWSDDCAYSVHDLEDAIFAGQVTVKNFENDFDTLHKEMVTGYKSDATKDEAAAALLRLQELSCWPVYFDRTHRSLARLKDSTSQLIGRFVLAAESETRRIHGDGPLTRYSANLEIPREAVIEVDFLKAVAGHYLISAAASQDRYEKQQVLIQELVEMLFQSAPAELDPIFEDDWKLASSDGEKLRVVIDQIASLTDPGAYALHAHLTAQLRKRG
ncbi:MAG: deoxyguanosinetriphosphate triphosphohydrolase [Actinobacteria bacterium]|nr:deoxyguanosinetriphosphate triphosphohydrolase [Actinomycetota bacterium]MTA21950.1 deoxyguanosinetriphosphate triphosphohydrolase [Actinomycetota bacterium]